MLNITILVDNETTKSNLETEHGFSVLLESNEGIILFDTGQSDMIIRNAKALDIDLSKIDYIILSHGHYDHTGGLEAVLKETNNEVDVEITQKKKTADSDKVISVYNFQSGDKEEDGAKWEN